MLSAAASASADPLARGEAIANSYIVVYEKAAGSVSTETAAREERLGFKSGRRFSRALEGFSATLTPGQVKRLRDDPEVDFVTQNRRVRATGSVPLVGADTSPSGVRRIHAASATTARQASGVNVAVIDTGIKLSHPDLNVVSGTNCISPGSPADDDNGHGTHVAGTIAAENDGSGVVGVAPGTRTYAVKVLDTAGEGSMASVICGIDWVTANHAALNIDVANMSLGGSGPPVGSCASTTDAEHVAICGSTAAGVNYVVAAGNDGWDFDYPPIPDLPAAYPQVLTVSAVADSDGDGGGLGSAPSCDPTDPDDTPASFSNYALTPAGQAHTIAAPGVCILSTWSNGGYETISGTSMASAHAAGVLARCLDEAGVRGPCSTRTPAQVIAYLRDQAQTYAANVPDHGFAGDPSSPGGNFYGYLIAPYSETRGVGTIASAAATTGAGTVAAGSVIAAPTAPAKANLAGARRTIRVRRGRFSYLFRGAAGLTGSTSFRSVRRIRVSTSRRRRVTLARKSFTAPAGGRVTLRVKLSRKNLRILRLNRRITVRVTVKLRNAAGLSSTATRRLTLKI